jgi:FkbM family methyltransferase
MIIIDVVLPNGYIARAIEQSRCIIDEIWERNVYGRRFILREGMTVIDIGANQGFFSMFAAAKGATVYAYEPEKTNYSLLCENVAANGLSDNIKCHRIAVGSANGIISLYVPDFNKPSASGLVTTNEKFLADFFPDEKDTVIMQESPCVTLASLLAPITTVDLLKIDCEGAELEILSSVTEKEMRTVQNIILETHETYKASELYWRLRELGFSVMSFQRPLGTARRSLGYVYARNVSLPDSDPAGNQSPVAIVSVSPFICIGETARGAASESFSLRKKDAELSIRWFVDDDPDCNAEGALFSHAFDQVGRHEITAEISDGQSVTREKRAIWVFEQDYFQAEKNDLVPANSSVRFRFQGKQSFTVKSSSIPKNFEYDKIVIGFTIGPHAGTVAMLFNGETEELPEGYVEKEFLQFPCSVDILFNVVAENEVSLELKWWTCNNICAELDPLILEGFRRRSVVPLEKCGSPQIITIEGNKTFGIHKGMLPDGWMPTRIGIGVTRIDGCSTASVLSFTITKGEIRRSVGGYTEFGIDRSLLADEVLLTVKTEGDPEQLKIVWWCE